MDLFSGSALDRDFLTVIFCAGFMVLLKRQFHWGRVFRENPWLMLLFIYMLMSLFWSDIPFVSFKRWFRELGAVIMALVVASDPAPRQAMQSILRRTTYILIPFSLYLIKYVPELGIEFHRWTGERMWIGVTLQKNGLGRLCVICGFFLIWTFVRRWKGRDVAVSRHQTYAEAFLLFLTLWLLKGPGLAAYPATAVIALILGIVLYGYLLWSQAHHARVSPATMATLLAVTLVYGIATPLIAASSLGNFLSILGRDATFTGRTAIWRGLLPVASQQTLCGLGFGSFWTPYTRIHYVVGEAHNGYLDIVLDIGYLGLFLMTIFLLSSCRRAVKGLALDFDWACLWICLLFVTVLHNATESSLNSFASPLTALLVFLAIAFPAMAASNHENNAAL
jgi:O-antigen ligase